jgi:hypothetical protein
MVGGITIGTTDGTMVGEITIGTTTGEIIIGTMVGVIIILLIQIAHINMVRAEQVLVEVILLAIHLPECKYLQSLTMLETNFLTKFKNSRRPLHAL